MEDIIIPENTWYIYDRKRNIYVSRPLITNEERVIKAADLLRESKDLEVRNFAEYLLSLRGLKFQPVEFSSVKSLGELVKVLESPFRGYRTRILTKEELEYYEKWARKEDPFDMYESMIQSWGEIVFDPLNKKYLIGTVFVDDDDNPISYIGYEEDINEILQGRSTIGVFFGAREVLEPIHKSVFSH